MAICVLNLTLAKNDRDRVRDRVRDRDRDRDRVRSLLGAYRYVFSHQTSGLLSLEVGATPSLKRRYHCNSRSCSVPASHSLHNLGF